jgi:hypothetical protein
MFWAARPDVERVSTGLLYQDDGRCRITERLGVIAMFANPLMRSASVRR